MGADLRRTAAPKRVSCQLAVFFDKVPSFPTSWALCKEPTSMSKSRPDGPCCVRPAHLHFIEHRSHTERVTRGAMRCGYSTSISKSNARDGPALAMLAGLMALPILPGGLGIGWKSLQYPAPKSL